MKSIFIKINWLLLKVYKKIRYEISEIVRKIVLTFNPFRGNSSIIEYHGNYYIATRKNDRFITISKLILSSDSSPHIAIEEKEIKLSPNRPRKDWVTDPRLFIFNDRLYCAYTYEIYPPKGSRQGLAEIDQNGKVLSDRVFKDSCRTYEKNWSFFESNGELLFIYETGAEHVVMDLEMNVRGRTKGVSWEYGQPRGGTPPIKIGDRYISVFHSSVETDQVLPYGAMKRKYFAGWYSYSIIPPFNVLENADKPIIFPEKNKMVHHDSVFPCGLIRHFSNYLVSYGLNDREVRIVELDKEFKQISKPKKVVWKKSVI